MIKSLKIEETLLLLSMMMMGACGIVYEYTFSTEASFLLGNSTEQWALTLGMMLFFMALGSGYSQKIKGNLFTSFILIEILISVLGAIGPLCTFYAFSRLTHFHLIYYSFVSTIGFLIGLEIPILLLINTRYTESLKTNISKILFMDYFGALLGSLLFAFYLIRTYPTTQIGILVGGANLLVAFLACAYFWKYLTHKRSLIGVFLGSALLLMLLAVKNEGWVRDWEQNHYKDPIILSKTSPYQHLTLTQHRQNKEAFWFYINGHLQFSSLDEYIYHEMLVHPAITLANTLSDSVQNILILGGGDGLALREVLKYPSIKKITLVDIDPLMVSLAKSNPLLKKLNQDSFSDKKVSIIHTDADLFVRELEERHDVILIDFPDPKNIEIAKLYAVDFYSRLHSLLKKGGVIAIQSGSPFYAKESFLCIERTLKAAGFHVLPYKETVPSFGPWGFMLAWDIEVSEKRVLENLNKRSSLDPSIPTRYINDGVFRKAFLFGNEEKTSVFQGINTRLNPVLEKYYRKESWLQ